MLPATGTFAGGDTGSRRGFQLHVQEQGGKLAGREIQYFKVDDERPVQGHRQRVNKLIKRDNVDVLVGTVPPGVALAMAKAAKGQQHAPDQRAQRRRRRDHRPMCGAQHRALELRTGSRAAHRRGGRAEGLQARDDHHLELRRRRRDGEGLRRSLREGGKVIKDLNLPFPNVEFQALLTEIAAQKPDVVFAFFAGGGAVKFVLGLRRGRAEEQRPAVRLGLPHRRHAAGAGPVGAGPVHHAALRRQPRHRRTTPSARASR